MRVFDSFDSLLNMELASRNLYSMFCVENCPFLGGGLCKEGGRYFAFVNNYAFDVGICFVMVILSCVVLRK